MARRKSPARKKRGRTRREARRRRMTRGARRGAMPRPVQLILTTVATLIASAFFWVMALQPLLILLDTHRWQPTTCTITHSKLGVYQEGGRETYRLDLDYTFNLNGEPGIGHRYDLQPGTTTQRERLAQILYTLPLGTETDCLVDPDDLSKSVLKASLGNHLWWGMVLWLPILLISLYATLRTIRGWLRFRKKHRDMFGST